MKYSDKTQILLSNENLFNAAIEEFSSKSYSLSSTNEIIKNSGINKGSFYYRFNNKEELFIALSDHVIVTQIDLFNKRNFNLSSNNSLKDLLFEFFVNLYLLNNYDRKFYRFIVTHLYDPESQHIIKSNCIEPLYFRLKKQINLFKDNHNFNYIEILIDNLYQNFPQFLRDSSDIESDLSSFIDFILIKPETSPTNLTYTLSNFDIKDSISYILVDSNKQINSNEKLSYLADYYQKAPKIDKELKKLTKLYRLTYQKLILSIIKKSFKDISYFQKLLDREIIDLSKTDEDFFQILRLLIYLSIKEVEYIVLDHTINMLNSKAKALIYRDILPILSKTSKIVVISDAFNLNNDYINLYIVDNLNQIKKLDYDAIKNKYRNTYEISTIVDKKTIYKILSISELSDYLDNKDNLAKLKHIKSLTTIDYQTIIRNEVLK